jgi:hypothetical protein
MQRNEHKRLKTIGWLMLASELLLALFAGSWLMAQYKAEEQRLHTDINIVFDRTRENIMNSALDKEISLILRDSVSAYGKRINLQLSFFNNSHAPNCTFSGQLSDRSQCYKKRYHYKKRE